MLECNCAAIPGTMAESELFGHEEGAFPGATQRRKGKFELAGEGTLFLDEVGELSLDTQAKLLRVLQERQFERLGGEETLEARARLICATLRPLDDMVREKEFREDILNRINVFPIYIPALRERREEILALAHVFLKRHDSDGRIQGFSAEAALALTSYDWPDNIRGLDKYDPAGSCPLGWRLHRSRALNCPNAPFKPRTEPYYVGGVGLGCDPAEKSVPR